MSSYRNGIYNYSHTSYLDGGVIIDISEDCLDRVQKLLTGIRGGWQRAVGSALKRAADAGKTAAKKQVTQEYTISQSTFLSETRNYNHFRGDTEVVFGYKGHVIPLMKFHTSVGKDGNVVTTVKKSGGAASLDHAFRAQMGRHVGIYERVGADRFPVKELYGPATPQMIYSNEDVSDKAVDAMHGTFEKRIEQEILRVMNGWGM